MVYIADHYFGHLINRIIAINIFLLHLSYLIILITNIFSAYMSGSGSPATSSAPTIYQVTFSSPSNSQDFSAHISCLPTFTTPNYSALLHSPSCRPDRPSGCPRLGHPEATGSKRLGRLAGKDKKEEQRLARPRDSGFLIGHFLWLEI